MSTAILVVALAGMTSLCIYLAINRNHLLREIGALIEHIDATTTPAATGKSTINRLKDAVGTLLLLVSQSQTDKRLLIEKVQDVICNMDAAGKILRVSPSCVAMLGFSAEELVGRCITDFLVSLPGETEEHTGKSQFERLMQDVSTASSFENQFVTKHGSTIDLLWSAYWSNSDRCFCCVIHNISERKTVERLIKQNEERIRSILDALPVSVLLVDSTASIELANAFAKHALGYDDTALTGISYQKLLSGTSVPRPSELEEGKAWQLVAMRLDGTTFPCEMVCSRCSFPDENSFLLVLVDISERQALRDTKMAFVAAIGHELRTPLSAIRTFLGCLATNSYGEVSEQLLNRAQRAERNLGRLMTLTNNLLDAEKADAGLLRLLCSEVNFSSLVRESVDVISSLLERANISLELKLQDDIRIYADRERIVQVLINLLSNSIKYSSVNTRIVITITARDGYAICSIADEGRGIPASNIENIFERFSQVRQDDRTKGFGLGLFLCKAIIEQHNGKIWATSDPEQGKGSCFSFSVPLAQK